MTYPTQPAPTAPAAPAPAPAFLQPHPAPTPAPPPVQPAAAPAAVPTAPAFVAPPAPAAPAVPQHQAGQPGSVPAQPAHQPPATGGDLGYPQGTPTEQMTVEQQVAYWRHHSRKHEDRVRSMADYDALRARAGQYDALLSSTQTEHERAVTEARRQGVAEGSLAAAAQVVEAYVRSAAAGRLDEQGVSTLLSGLDRTRFIENGQVDPARVSAFVHTVLPPMPQTAVAQPGVQPAGPVPAVATPPGPYAAPVPGYYQPGPPAVVPYPGQPAMAAGPGIFATPTAPGVPGAPAMPGVPGAPGVQYPGQPVGVPRLPDFGQGQVAAPPYDPFEAGRAAARARFGNQPVPPQPMQQAPRT